MPSSTPERQERWRSDAYAISYLEDRGYHLNRDWTWTAPKGRTITEDEEEAMIYLIEEWDFGGLDPDSYQQLPAE